MTRNRFFIGTALLVIFTLGIAIALTRLVSGGDSASGAETFLLPMVTVANATEDSAAEEPIDFNRDVRPILATTCFACHGPDLHAAAAGLSLHSFEAATAILPSGERAVVPGDVQASLLWERINDERMPMPPIDAHAQLTTENKETLRRWIEQGAPYMEHWAYVPPRLTPTPEVGDADWPAHWIDAYILNRLETEGWSPVPNADRATLIRRVYFDLIGLPPTPGEVQAFVSDEHPDAYERLIDDLLARPQFGEKLAVMWLDLVRYADTVGYHGDQEHYISPYRDWVIWALNRNMPMDEFMTHQLAGDLLEDADTNSKIASAYNRLIQTSHEGGVQFEEYVTIYDADRVRNVSEAFMGATIACAQCHDHKYDPYSAEDFYAFAAFFSDIDDLDHLRNPYDGLNNSPTARKPEVDVLSPLDHERRAAIIDELFTMVVRRDHRFDRALSLLESLRTIRPRRVMISQATEPREVRFKARGDWSDQTGDVMEPAVPTFLGTIQPASGGRATRLDLARWLTTPDSGTPAIEAGGDRGETIVDRGGVGGLTARVMVNRLWFLMFGEGLCVSLDDFGGQGMPPNHPELLDRLALELIALDWDLKAFLKTLALTRTYQLSSDVPDALRVADPNNTLFARQSTYRLPAEAIRDNALAISGLLVDQLGGVSSRPYQPEGYYQHLKFPRRQYRADRDEQQWRRGVYVHRQRSFLHPMMQAFDAPTREACTARRTLSNTPLAALVLMNDPTFVEAARGLAIRVLIEDPESAEGQNPDGARLTRMFGMATGRPPTPAESQVLAQLLEDSRIVFSADPARAAALLNVGLSAQRPELIPWAPTDLDRVELAAWSEVARVVLNLHETITRP